MTRLAAAGAALVMLLAGCSVLPQGPEALPSTFIPNVTPSASAPAHLVGGFSAVERQALRVRVRTCTGYGTGSAFAIDATHAVTNRHVVKGATDITLTGYDGTSYRVTSSVFSRTADLALLTVKDELPNVTALAEGGPEIGDVVSIAGYPKGEELALTVGPFLALVPETLDDAPDFVYEIAAESHPGNSGSPVVNQAGEVVGVLYASDDVHTSYAVSLKTLNDFLDTLDDAKRNTSSCKAQG